MQIDKAELTEIIQTVVNATVKALESKGYLGKANKTASASKNANASKGASGKTANANADKTAYQRTEQLLFNYNNFLKIIREKEQEIVELRKYGVPNRSGAVVQYGGNTGTVQGLVLEEERVETAVRTVEKSMETTRQAIALIDKNMATMKTDPYYKILEMRYFEGRTQEDIAVEFRCTQQNIAYHKNRLVRELSIKIFPDKVINEYLH